MKSWCRLLAATLALLLLVGGEADARRKKKRDPRAPFRVVAVVPPRVEITRARVLGGVPKVEDSMEAEDIIVRELEAELEARGYEVARGALSRERLAADPDLQYAVSDLQDRFDEVMAQLVSAKRPERDLEDGRFHLGDAALLVAGMAGVEGLVFARGQGVSTGGGTKAAVFFLTLGGGIPGSGISLRIGLVDGRDGRLVDVTGASKSGPILKKTEKIVSRPVERAVEELPAPASESREDPVLPPLPPAPPDRGEPESAAEPAESMPSSPAATLEPAPAAEPSEDADPAAVASEPEDPRLAAVRSGCLDRQSDRTRIRPDVCDCLVREVADLGEERLELLADYYAGEIDYPALREADAELADLEFATSTACWKVSAAP